MLKFSRAQPLSRVCGSRATPSTSVEGPRLAAGIHAALAAAPDLTAVVIADSRHSANSIEQISRHDDSLVIGANQPQRRNIVTLGATRALAGQPLSDPETTLRSIPAALLSHLLRMESNGFEFEVEMLLVADQNSIPILEEPVETVAQPDSVAECAPLASLRFAVATRPRRAVSFVTALVTAVILLAVTLAEIRGFATGHLFDQPILVALGPTPPRRILPRSSPPGACRCYSWSRWIYAAVFAAIATTATVLATGPLAVAGIVFFLASACALGSKLRGKAEPGPPEAHICATLLGIAIYAFAMTLTARIPVNYPAAWAAVLSIPILLDGRGVIRRFQELTALVRGYQFAQLVRARNLRPFGFHPLHSLVRGAGT